MKSTKILSLFLLVMILVAGCKSEKKVALKPEEAKAIAKEAFIFGFPVVMNYKTMYAYTLDKNSPEFKGDFNEFGCTARVYTPEDKTIVTPNSDTPYCMGWANISEEPVVISVPEMEEERFYHIQLIDMYTHNFAYVGTLTTGNGAGKFMVAREDWEGTIPENINDVIRSETDYFFMIIRTQIFGPDDLDRIKDIQGMYAIQSLSEMNGQAPPALTAPDVPVWTEGDQFNAAMFKYLDAWLKVLDPAETDKAVFERFEQLGLGTGSFDLDNFEPEMKAAIESGAEEGFKAITAYIQEKSGDPTLSARIFGTRAFLEESATEYFDLARPDMLRAAGAQAGLYGNSAAEAIYPPYYVDSRGIPLDASSNNYTLTFEADAFPPVKSFWSLTMYDGKTQLLIDNPLDRYLLNSPMMDSFDLNEDGSLTLYVQKDSPGEAFEANWLPAPNGPFYVIMRLYGPESEALEGQWSAPGMIRN